MTTWIYARVSQDETDYLCCGIEYKARFGATLTCRICQKDIDTNAPPARIEGQIREAQELAGRKGLSGATLLVRDVISADVALRNRPGGGRMWDRLQPGDTIVATTFDRLFRDSADAISTIAELSQRGIAVLLTQEKLGDQSTAIGKFITTIQAGASQYELDKQKERRQAGMRRAKDDGRTTGNPPFGKMVEWRIEGNKKVGYLVDNEQELDLLRMLCIWNNEGWSLPKITRQLARLGYKNRQERAYSERMVKDLRKLALQRRREGVLN